jgi:hypothetical protein
MSTLRTGRLEWELWKQGQANLERLARDAWMFEESPASRERPTLRARISAAIGAVLIAVGRRIAPSPRGIVPPARDRAARSPLRAGAARRGPWERKQSISFGGWVRP